MTTDSFRFRWWYLLLLLPVVLYLGARWYVGHRIDRAIADANDGGNTLTVEAYSYGLFPIHLTARGLRFDQDRPNLTARGSLSRLEATGLELFSLVGNDPIALQAIRLRGLDADLRLTGRSQRDSSSLKLEVAEIGLDSIFLTLVDEVAGQRARLADLSLSLTSFHLPFQPTGIQTLRLAADSVAYAANDSGLEVLAAEVGYATDSETIAVAELLFRRGADTEVRATDLRFSGLNAGDIDDAITLDSVTVASLRGGARVPGGSGEPADSSGRSPGPEFRLGTLRLPLVDLDVTGDFGSARLAGAVRADQLAYRDSLAIGRLSVSGDTVGFRRDSGLTVLLNRLQLEQQDLFFPLTAGNLGATDLSVPDLTVTVGGQTLTGTSLSYRSAADELTLDGLSAAGDRINGSVARITVSGIQRDSLLGGGAGTVQRAVVADTDLSIATGDGGRYAFRVPEVLLTDIRVDEGVEISRAQVTDADVSRFGSNGKKDLEGTGIFVDQYRITTPLRPGRLGPLKARMRQLHVIGSEQPVDYFLVAMAYDSRAGRMTLDSLRRHNRLSPEQMFRQEVAKSWLDMSMNNLRMGGIRHAELLSGDLIWMDSLSAADFQIRVVEDLSLSVASREKPMPIEALRKVGPRIVLKNARLSSSDISYAVVDSILDPKTIHFRNGTVSIAGLDTEESASDSVLATFDATFEGTTPLHAEFRLSRHAGGRDYSARGELGEYDLSRVNPLMRVAADAIIEQGVIERLTYRSEMRNDTVTGDMALLYRNLDLKVVGSGAWIKNLLSGVIVKDSNQRGEDFRQGQIFHEHIPEMSFFNSYWKGLVSGMRSTALSDIALPEELD